MRREARAQHRTLTAHCAHLVVHGMLHLQGYDHERDDDAARMEARESALLAQLGHPRPLRGRSGAVPDGEPRRTSRTKPTLLERLSSFLSREPEDREQLLELLHSVPTSAG